MQNNSADLPPYAVESVHNALQILMILSEAAEQRLSDVSERLGVARSTAHRLLSTLAHDGFVEQSPESKSYRLGPMFREVGLAAVRGINVLRVAHSHMELFLAEQNETINLLVAEGRSVRFIDGIESTHIVRVTSRIGWVRPMHITSAGKIFLAELDEPQLETYLQAGLAGFTDATLVDAEDLRADLVMIRAQAFAFNLGESDDSIHAVAVPVRDRHGRLVAGVAASVPASRGGADRLRELVPPLRQTAASISADL